MNIESGALPLRLVETLLKLHETTGSCVVRLERGSSKKQLVISNGTLAFAESNLPDEHLAHILIRLNLLSRKDLKKVSAEMKTWTPTVFCIFDGWPHSFLQQQGYLRSSVSRVPCFCSFYGQNFLASMRL
jgi:hypothetical protein